MGHLLTLFQDDATPIVVLGSGQSNVANWSSVASPYNKNGENALKSTLDNYNKGARNSYIAGAEGGAYLLRTAWNNSTATGGGPDPDEWFIDDTVEPWVAGPMITQMLAAITTAGYTPQQITHILFGQGESDQREIDNGGILASRYTLGLQWLIDYFYATFPNLRSASFRPLGRRSLVGSSGYPAYNTVRLIQQQVAASDPTRVSYGSETYDLAMKDEEYTTGDDAVHRSPEAYAIEGSRAAKEILHKEGIYFGNTHGPIITGVSYTGGVIIVTVSHDKGTALANKAGTAYSGSPIDVTPVAGKVGVFRLFDSGDSEITITSVHITGASEITITPSITLLRSGYQLKHAHNAICSHSGSTPVPLDVNSVIYDNHADNPLPIQASYSGSFNADLSALESMSNLVSFFSPEATYYAAGTASDAVVWTKRAGSAGSARKDDAKPAPVRYADSNMGLGVAGYYFDGSTSMKLLVEHALTTSSNYTLIIAATPDHDATDPSTGTSTNGLITTSDVSTANRGLFAISQSVTTKENLTLLAAGHGVGTVVHQSTTAVAVIRRDGSSAKSWRNTGEFSTATITNTPLIESDGGTPVYAIGNVVDKTSGNDTVQAFLGAVHYIALFDTALSDAQVVEIQRAIGAACGVSIS